MPIYNSEIAQIFNQIADILDIMGENKFKIRAYRNTARQISTSTSSLADLIKDQARLKQIPGIGEELAQKITEIVHTGKLRYLIQLQKQVSKGLLMLLGLEGLGPKRVRLLNKKLKIESINDLKKAIAAQKLDNLPGFGKKLINKIKKSAEAKPSEKRYLLDEVEQYIQSLIKYLKASPAISRIEVAGSYRRRQETIGDIDILVETLYPQTVSDYFTGFEDIKKVIAKGDTKTSILLRTGLQVDARFIKPKSFGAAFLYFTGSKNHNIQLRTMALEQGLKINEYGLFKGNKNLAHKEEKDIYSYLGLCYIPPELRENQGEIEAAKKNELPNLINVSDLKGDLQMHTKESDGEATIDQMAIKAKELGYQYIAITDHSVRMGVAHGLTPERLLGQIKQIDLLNQKFMGIKILKSLEVDILKNGTLDMPFSVLSKLDIVTCSIHSYFNLTYKE